MSIPLHQFIVTNREEIIVRARTRLRIRKTPKSTEARLEHGVPVFLSQLADALVPPAASAPPSTREMAGNKQINDSAALNGHDLLRNGYTVAEVVHGYGDVCQVVTELAGEMQAPISTDDFHAFNRYLDDAIAGAVTAYGSQRETDLASEDSERLGAFAHEFRNLLNTAILSFDVIKRGTVGLGGSTGSVHSRSLSRLRELVERSLTLVRMEHPLLEPFFVSEFIEEMALSFQMEAVRCGVPLSVDAGDSDIVIDADRHLLASALSNLLQNAFKFTKPGGGVVLVATATAERVSIEVKDGCGGLPPSTTAGLFMPFTRQGGDNPGLGLGLSIARRATLANLGTLRAHDAPGRGCVFTIDLPRSRRAVV